MSVRKQKSVLVRRQRGTMVIALLVGLASALVGGTSALASAPTATLTDTTDLTPGQSVSATVVDSSGNLCDASYGVGEWNLFISWHRADDPSIIAGYSVAQSAQSSAYVLGASNTWTGDFYVVWLQHDPGASDPDSWDGAYQAYVGCMTPVGLTNLGDNLGSDHTGTFAGPIAVTYTPVTLSRDSIPRGETLDVTVTDSTQRWCNFNAGAGFSMGILLRPHAVGGSDVWIPADLPVGGVPGVGSFTWANGDAIVTATIPASTVTGDYLLWAGCVGSSPTFEQYVRGAVYPLVTITAVTPTPTPEPSPNPPLPNTGQPQGTVSGTLIGGVAIVVLGICVVRLRKRVPRL